NSNKLNTLPESFGNLKNLKQLYIDYNHLTSLPESFGQLKNLKYLSLEKNPLQYVPDSFASLPKLSFLVVDNEIIKNLKTILKNQSIFNIIFNSDRPEESFLELLKRGRI
ncbi:MAG: leucine-rich repeat domain-containing protein, partial [Candidatus Hodarchaeales archaeon]